MPKNDGMTPERARQTVAQFIASGQLVPKAGTNPLHNNDTQIVRKARALLKASREGQPLSNQAARGHAKTEHGKPSGFAKTQAVQAQAAAKPLKHRKPPPTTGHHKKSGPASRAERVAAKGRELGILVRVKRDDNIVIKIRSTDDGKKAAELVSYAASQFGTSKVVFDWLDGNGDYRRSFRDGNVYLATLAGEIEHNPKQKARVAGRGNFHTFMASLAEEQYEDSFGVEDYYQEAELEIY